MTIEQVKAEAKKRFQKDLTDEQAQALLEEYGGELSDEHLQQVTGGVVPICTLVSKRTQEIFY